MKIFPFAATIIVGVDFVTMDTTPFGGVRSSGYGREGIKYALDGFSQWKFTGIRFPGRE